MVRRAADQATAREQTWHGHERSNLPALRRNHMLVMGGPKDPPDDGGTLFRDASRLFLSRIRGIRGYVRSSGQRQSVQRHLLQRTNACHDMCECPLREWFVMMTN